MVDTIPEGYKIKTKMYKNQLIFEDCQGQSS